LVEESPVTDEVFDRPLRVVKLIATRKTDEDRGPLVALNPDDAKARVLTDGELAWVYSPRRRHELATVRIDPELRQGDVVLRDIVGASPSEVVRVVKPDLDTPKRRRGAFA
jgi:anaerobic selenocysteine-containing dehydrogenase